MPIKGQCPNCRAPFAARDAMLGRTGRCRRCGVQFSIRPDKASAPDMPLAIDRYQVLELLGRGTFGAVYRAFDPRLERDVAIKVLRQEMTSSPESVQRFLREAKAAAKLTHPHIVPVHDAGRAGDLYFIAAGFIKGKTLASAIPRGGMDPRLAARLIAQLASALGYAHRQGVLHRDVKPANALLDMEGSLHLTDFGLAGWTQDDATRLTRDGAMMGTLAYTAPEQASGDMNRVGPQADLYSAGVVLYELLTGRLPFEGHPAALVYQIVHTAPPPPSRYRRDVNAALEAVCMKALAKAPGQRYRTGEEMATALQAAAAQPVPRPAVIEATRDYRPGQTTTEADAVGDLRPAENHATEHDASQAATPGPAGSAAPKLVPGTRPPARTRGRWVLRSMAAVVVLAGLAGVAALWVLSHRPAPLQTTVVGKVFDVDKNRLIVTVDDAEEVFTVPDDAKVLIDKADGKLSVIRTGFSVAVTRKGDVVAVVEAQTPPKPSPTAAPFDAAAARQAQQAWADYLGVHAVREVNLGGVVTMKLVLIPPGSFLMGSRDSDQPDEKPQHKATITKPFYLGMYPVTQEQYKRLTGKDSPSSFAEGHAGQDKVKGLNTASFPVESISWDDAAAFCDSLNQKDAKRPAEWKYALPTEAQWEYACRAGTTTAYFFGDDVKDLGGYAWDTDNSDGRTHEVGTRKPNPWGLCDMHGNVWQWCQDWYAAYPNNDVTDPVTTVRQTVDARILRGGSWLDDPKLCRSAYRSRIASGYRGTYIGCRVCLNLN